MKKAILYLIFLGLVFSNSQAHAVAFSPDAKIKIAIHKIHNENGVCVSKKGSFSHKADLLNDFVDDFDDFDDHDTSVKAKLYVINTNTPCFNSNQLTADYSCKTFCNRSYYHVNFSRLPRFNYISLRVLRL